MLLFFLFFVGFVLNKMQPGICRASVCLFFCLHCRTGTFGKEQEQTPAGIMQWNGHPKWLYLKWLGILTAPSPIKMITLKAIDKCIQLKNISSLIVWTFSCSARSKDATKTVFNLFCCCCLVSVVGCFLVWGV